MLSGTVYNNRVCMWIVIVLVIACVIVILVDDSYLKYIPSVNCHCNNQSHSEYAQTDKTTTHYLSLLTSNLRVVQEGIRVVDTPSSCFPLPRPLKNVLIPP